MAVVVSYTSRRRPVVRRVSRLGSLGVYTSKRSRSRGCRKPPGARKAPRVPRRAFGALTLTASPRRDVADLDSTTVLIDGFPGAARRIAATYVLTNTHRPTPSGRSVQNHRDTDANRVSHRREPRGVVGPRARSMLKMGLVQPKKVILSSRRPWFI